MSKTSFKTNPIGLEELLRSCEKGKIQLPDFQRSWVWEEERIKSLIASISQAFPVGALMTLETKAGAATTFARRPVAGASAEAAATTPDQLLLDGQQRMTSLYQTCLRQEVVQTITERKKIVRHWFYINIAKALDPDADRVDAIVAVPEDRIIRKNFNREELLNLSTPEREFTNMMFPLNAVFDHGNWHHAFMMHCFKTQDQARVEQFQRFKTNVLENFLTYQVPVITLGHDTSHEAVCLVFEKVNTGGKPLDAFELVTAMYAAENFRLRDDWLGADGNPGIQARLAAHGAMPGQKSGLLSKVASTDFLQAVALRHSKIQRLASEAEGVKPEDLPPVRATRRALLELPLKAYREHREVIEAGFKAAAKFLHKLNILKVDDLPYQTQLVPLAAIFAELGAKAEHIVNQQKLERWFWCGVFGELYGSAIESRFAKDVLEVPTWLEGGPLPSTVKDGVFRAERLRGMRTRLSAAYKGVHVLLMRQGAQDFRTGQKFADATFFSENVDIHHIFPRQWCDTRTPKIDPKIYDTIINKTPLSDRTNRSIGGKAPTDYLARLQHGTKSDPAIPAAMLDAHLRSHAIEPALLRADAFEAFMADREHRLLELITGATGHQAISAELAPSEGEDPPDEIARDAGLASETVDLAETQPHLAAE